MLIVPDGNEVVVIARPEVTVIVNAELAVSPLVSVAVIVALYVFADVGVPDRTPVVANVIPLGSVPEETLHV
jgi:hypothetical protein